MNTDKKWAVVVALPHEAKAVLGKMKVDSKTVYKAGVLYQGHYQTSSQVYPLLLLRTGLGPVQAASATHFLCQHFPFTHLLITGYCGGLKEGLSSGDGIIAHQVKNQDSVTSISFDKFEEGERLFQVLKEKQIAAEAGLILQSPEPIRTSEQKKKLYEETGALAVDMESFSVLNSVAAFEQKTEQKITSFVLRFVVDTREHELADTKSFVNDQGGVRPFKLASEMIKSPGLIMDLTALEQLAEKARSQLTKSIPVILETL